MSNATAERIVRARPFAGAGRRTAVAAPALGLGGALLAFLGSGNPSFWGDEAASVMSAERPLATLWPELGRVDAVHGAYYLFLHFWIELFGASELSVRLPSVVAVGLATAGTVVLARRLFGLRVAVVAGIVFAVLPRVSYMGAEARSYAMGTAIAVWLTVLFFALLERPGRRMLPWFGYAVALAAAIYVFLYLALLVIVHGLVLLVARRRLLRTWLGAVGIGSVLAAPVVVYGLAEHGQLTFLAHRAYATLPRIFVIQWFGNGGLALLCWALVLVAGWSLVRALRHPHTLRYPSDGLSSRAVVATLVAAWFVLPTAILLAGNAWIAPMYTVRYLSFCTPVVAIAVALGIDALARLAPGRGRVARGLPVLAVVIVALLAAPTDIAQRGPFAKDGGSDWRQASAAVAAHAHPGDAVVFDQAPSPSRKPRLALRLYPRDYAGLQDVGLVTPYYDTAGLWDRVAPVQRVAGRLATITTVWALEETASSDPVDLTQLERLGFRVVDSIPIDRTTVYELSRETP